MSDLHKIKKLVRVSSCMTFGFGGTEDLFEVEDYGVGSLYSVDKDTYILSYESYVGDNKVTNTIKISKGIINIVQIGNVHARYSFEANQWLSYQTFYSGASQVCRSFTKRLDYSFTPDGGYLEILYELWSGDTHMGYYHLDILVE